MTKRYRIKPRDGGGYKVQIKHGPFVPWVSFTNDNGYRQWSMYFATMDAAKAFIDADRAKREANAAHMAMAPIEHPPQDPNRRFWLFFNTLFIGAGCLWIGMWLGVALLQRGVLP